MAREGAHSHGHGHEQESHDDGREPGPLGAGALPDDELEAAERRAPGERRAALAVEARPAPRADALGRGLAVVAEGAPESARQSLDAELHEG
jgi:hypothetical protein